MPWVSVADEKLAPPPVAKFQLPIHIARFFGLVPYILDNGKIQISRGLFWYGALLGAVTLMGKYLYAYYSYKNHERGSGEVNLADVVMYMTDLCELLMLTINFVFLIRRQFPTLIEIMKRLYIKDRVGRISNTSLHIFALETIWVLLRQGMVIAALGSAEEYMEELLEITGVIQVVGSTTFEGDLICIFNGNVPAFFARFAFCKISMSRYATDKEPISLISVAELVLFVHLVDVVGSTYEKLNSRLAEVLKSNSVEDNVVLRAVEVRKMHKSATDSLEEVCKCFGPQIAFMIVSRSMNIIKMTHEIGKNLTAFHAGHFEASRTLDTFVHLPVKLITFVWILKAANRTTDMGTAAASDIHSLWNSPHRSEMETKQLFGAQVVQRPTKVSLCGFLSLDFSILLGGIMALVNYNVLLIQLRDVKITEVERNTPTFLPPQAQATAAIYDDYQCGI